MTAKIVTVDFDWTETMSVLSAMRDALTLSENPKLKSAIKKLDKGIKEADQSTSLLEDAIELLHEQYDGEQNDSADAIFEQYEELTAERIYEEPKG